MKRLRCMGAVALNLLVDCISFHIPNTLPPSPPISTGCRFPTPESRLALWPHSHESGSQTSRHWKSPLIRALTSSDEIEQLQKVDESSSDCSYAVDDTSTFTPNILWWTKSRAEEDVMLNLMANAGFIAVVVIFSATTVFTIDMEISRGWTTGEFLLRVPVDNWLAYMGVLRDSPVMVKACTSGIVYTLGDWTAQMFEGTALADIKRGRVARSAMAGLLLHGPLSHVWYDLCESAFDFIGWNEYWWVAGPKVVTDQILWGPFWNAVYICFLGVLKRDAFETIREAVVTTALPLVIAGIRLWPLAHLVTYGLIPTENRLLWVDFVEIIWVTILSKQAADQARASQESTAASEVHTEPKAATETETETTP